MTKRHPLYIAVCVGVFTSLLLALGSFAQTDAPAAAPEAFPILSRVEMPRDYGFFLGDAIPLTLIVEANNGVVLDLVNLPKKGEKHGLFEVRDVQLASSAANGRKVYRAQYTLQYFGATPLGVHFEPLEILYALPEDRQAPANTYHYKSLRTQPVLINVSRIGPYRPTPALDIKGPQEDSRAGIIWLSVTVGACLLLTSMSGLVWHWRQHRRQRRVTFMAALSPAARTLAILRQEGMALRSATALPAPGAEQLSEVIRQYLHEALGVPARTLTHTELASLLQDKPLGTEILYLLERCDALKYQAPACAQDEEGSLWWEAMTLFEKLQEDDMA